MNPGQPVFQSLCERDCQELALCDLGEREPIDAGLALTVPVKDQKKLLKLSTGGKVSYEQAKRYANYPHSTTKAVAKYLKPHFKKHLEVLD